jgi:tagatose-1,6-bisphosphate aldolase non-catalytic subunit AgaZ/GatZ
MQQKGRLRVQVALFVAKSKERLMFNQPHGFSSLTITSTDGHYTGIVFAYAGHVHYMPDIRTSAYRQITVHNLEDPSIPQLVRQYASAHLLGEWIDFDRS